MACPCAVATRPTPKSSYDTEEERLRNASTVVDENRLRTIFLIPDMHCIACVRRIETRLSQLEFVVEARANLTQKTVRADWRPRDGMARTISEALDQEGFSATVLHSDNDASTTMSNSYQRLLSCVAVAGFAAANVMLLSVSVWSGASGETRDLFHLISGLIAIPAAAYAGRPFFNSAMAALRNWRLNMDVPISLAIVLALAMSLAESLRGGEEAYFDAALMLLFFLLIGRTLDALMRDRARRAIDVLSKIAAKGAVRLSQEGKHEFVDVGVLQPGDHVFLAAGERVPTDGLVRSDEGGVLDRSLVTGESEHVRVDKGEEVEAGTLNMAGPMEIEVTRTADESFLGEVAQMMAAAESGRSRFVRMADRVAGYYAPAVHLLALIAFVGWMIATAGDWQLSLYTAIAVLIITCPCALGLAVPVVQVIAAGELFARGILVKDGSALERLSEVDTVVFDKTGTLTFGQLELVNSNVCDRDGSIAAALAISSRHPAAQAIARYYEKQSVPTVVLDRIREVAGAGVEATWQGQTVRLGRRDWVAEIARFGSSSTVAPSSSCVSFAISGHGIAEFQLADVLRPDAGYPVRCFSQAGFDVWILSGDSGATVARVADELGIAHYKSEQRPADKIAELEALSSHDRRVLMIGDGLNDGPALAASHVSMAPSSGSDVGRQAADFVFTTEHLRSVVYAWQVARKARVIAWQNIGLAICYNCVAVPLAMAGYVTPLLAAVAMSASSILVVGNSLRLYGFKDQSVGPGRRSDALVSYVEDRVGGSDVAFRVSA